MPGAAGEPAFRLAANGTDTEVLVDGVHYVTLRGITDLTGIEIGLTGSDPEPLVPGQSADTFVGTDGTDQVRGMGGDDSLSGMAGDDFLAGNAGDDSIDGGDGDDSLVGGTGNDSVQGGTGDDHVLLGEGDDEYRGQGYVPWGDPVPASGKDFIRGGAGNDSILERNGADTLHGDLGNDSLSAVDGPLATDGTADTLYGGFGRDQLNGDDGDTLDGGAGIDSYVVEDYLGDDAPVVITNLEPGESIFIIGGFNTGPDDDDQPQFRIAANGVDTEIIANGVAVIVQGRTDFESFDVVLGHA